MASQRRMYWTQLFLPMLITAIAIAEEGAPREGDSSLSPDVWKTIELDADHIGGESVSVSGPLLLQIRIRTTSQRALSLKPFTGVHFTLVRQYEGEAESRFAVYPELVQREEGSVWHTGAQTFSPDKPAVAKAWIQSISPGRDESRHIILQPLFDKVGNSTFWLEFKPEKSDLSMIQSHPRAVRVNPPPTMSREAVALWNDPAIGSILNGWAQRETYLEDYKARKLQIGRLEKDLMSIPDPIVRSRAHFMVGRYYAIRSESVKLQANARDLLKKAADVDKTIAWWRENALYVLMDTYLGPQGINAVGASEALRELLREYPQSVYVWADPRGLISMIKEDKLCPDWILSVRTVLDDNLDELLKLSASLPETLEPFGGKSDSEPGIGRFDDLALVMLHNGMYPTIIEKIRAIEKAPERRASLDRLIKQISVRLSPRQDK